MSTFKDDREYLLGEPFEDFENFWGLLRTIWGLWGLHALKHDPVYQAVMETVDHAMHINKAKTFNNALEVAIETRKFLILQATEEAMRVACNEGKTWAIASTEDDG